MLRVALTGGIATGKSHVLEQFKSLGVATLDADTLAHGVTGPGTEASQAIGERFGASVIAPDGGVDRRALGALVFRDARARRDLEAIVHPAVYRSIAAGFRAFELVDGSPFAVADIPLLYESGRERDFDVVVATVCRPEIQLKRLLDRGLSRSDADDRLAAQLPAEVKAARAEYVIQTDGSLSETDAQVRAIWTELTRRSTH